MNNMNKIGANWRPDDGCHFEVWAPLAQTVSLKLHEPHESRVEMEPGERGYFHIQLESVKPGDRYSFVLNGEKVRPDPASRCQPLGVHGPPQVVDPFFDWTDEGWKGVPWDNYILYELHVGTFTREGTLEAIIPKLDYLLELGVTAIELMPLAQFSGERNWGYDGVFPYAVHSAYGDSIGLKRLVDACHNKGLAVAVDVVYNHLGPEGNYFWDFGYYFTDRYKTPWGPAINFDGEWSDEVRRYFLENAMDWFEIYHIDALRLDAVHAIYDFSAHPFLQELSEQVRDLSGRLGRELYLIAESDRNDTRILMPVECGGMGMTAQWSDDFHHVMHVLLTGEYDGYYCDYGGVDHLCKAYREGFVFSGQYAPHRKRRHGNSSRDVPARQFVVCVQNHDQIGNRMFGDRLSNLIDLEGLKLAAGSCLLSPYIPLLFMGEEYGENSPFPYFISHGNEDLVEAVRQGRKKEFAHFAWQGEPPDPQAEQTFHSGKLQPAKRFEGHHQLLYDFYKQLIDLRKTRRDLFAPTKAHLQVDCPVGKQTMIVRRGRPPQDAFILMNFSKEPDTITLNLPEGHWEKLLDSSDERWGGPGSRLENLMKAASERNLTLQPLSIVVYMRI